MIYPITLLYIKKEAYSPIYQHNQSRRRLQSKHKTQISISSTSKHQHANHQIDLSHNRGVYCLEHTRLCTASWRGWSYKTLLLWCLYLL